MKDKVDGFFFGIVCTVIFFVIVSIMLPSPIRELKREAIEKGYAQYDPQTGNWTWKCDLSKTEQEIPQ